MGAMGRWAIDGIGRWVSALSGRRPVPGQAAMAFLQAAPPHPTGYLKGEPVAIIDR